jgi:hypothetical protein
MKSLKYILGFVALITLFTACTKDEELIAPAIEMQNNMEKKGTGKGENGKPVKPRSDSGDGQSLPSGNSGTGGLPGDSDDSDISDDDDDESDDDTSTRSK